MTPAQRQCAASLGLPVSDSVVVDTALNARGGDRFTSFLRVPVRPPASARSGVSLSDARLLARACAEEVCPRVDEYGDAAELVTSELVTNALKHAAPTDDEPVYIEFPSCPWAFQVRVLDPSPTPPREVVAYDDDMSGRGLVLVHHFASQYGGHLNVEITEDGKTVTCTLPVQPTSRAAEEASA
ncbi:ATP-binding protein [Streptomyces chrestomyceticus]|uniref:ATP-binding protein n=1 Tax=Streptomyces chrestomyceticus TaxID=68185 RepID=UPI003687DBA8